MEWTFSPDRPIYLQIVEQIKLKIISGEYPPGYRIESVRDLAEDAGVNPNTMQRAFSELEREGLVFTQRNRGRFITEDINKIKELKDSMAIELISEFFKKMQEMGYSEAEILEFIESIVKE